LAFCQGKSWLSELARVLRAAEYPDIRQSVGASPGSFACEAFLPPHCAEDKVEYLSVYFVLLRSTLRARL